MTIILLVSASLLALVVTSHPILSDSGLGNLNVPTSSMVWAAVQAPFRIHPGVCTEDSLHLTFHSQDPKSQVEHLFELGTRNIAARVPDHITPSAKPSLDDICNEVAGRQDPSNANKELDRSRVQFSNDHQSIARPMAYEQRVASIDKHPAASFVLLTFSCIAAFLALACVALALYATQSLSILASQTAWNLLLIFWRRARSQENPNTTTKKSSFSGSCLLLWTGVEEQCLLGALEGRTGMHDLLMKDKPLQLMAVLDMALGCTDEKVQDVTGTSVLPFAHDLSPEEHMLHLSLSDDSLSPSLWSCAAEQSIGDRDPLMLGPRTSHTSRPAWSIRAVNSPPLGLCSSEIGGVDSTMQAPIHSRRRAYRSAVPELDIALAMQLRPGLGIGADPAWMVRFLMAIFGWFAVALTTNAR